MSANEAWRAELERWLVPFLSALSHPARHRMCPAYVAGLIGPGDRKSVQPMAARADGVGYDRLHHFVAAGVWDAEPLEAALLTEADRLFGDEDAFLVVAAQGRASRPRVRILPVCRDRLASVHAALAALRVRCAISRIARPENGRPVPARAGSTD